MPELKLHVRAPLEGLVQPGPLGAATSIPGLFIEERTDLSLATVIARRGETQSLKRAVAAAYRLDLPDGPRVAGTEGISFAGVGVGQWFAAAEGVANKDFISGLHENLRGLASIADQSDARVIRHLQGDRVREILAKGVPIDLHPRSFRTGDVATTVVAYIGVQIQQLDDRPTFQLMAFRSFAGSLWSWLTKSAAEFGAELKPSQT